MTIYLTPFQEASAGNNQIRIVTEIAKKYIFSNCTEEIYPLVNDVIGTVGQHIPGEKNTHLISVIRQVIIELLTNGVKHSCAGRSMVKISLTDERMLIYKNDYGKVFVPGDFSSWPLVPGAVGQKVTIQTGDFYSLWAVIESETSVCFELEEYPVGMVGPDSDLPQHFGFLILTKASRRFSYRYNPDDGSNHFIVEIDMNDVLRF